MATLSWGKPKVEFAPYVPLENPTVWSELPDIKQDTAKLTTTKGSKLEALNEGGELIDSKTLKNKFNFECDIFVQKGMTRPFTDVDGQITGFWALRLTPEDNEMQGWIIDRTSVSCEESWTSKEGTLLKYIFEALDPWDGNILKSYTKP